MWFIWTHTGCQGSQKRKPLQHREYDMKEDFLPGTPMLNYIPSFHHFFHKNLLKTCFVPGSDLGSKDYKDD